MWAFYIQRNWFLLAYPNYFSRSNSSTLKYQTIMQLTFQFFAGLLYHLKCYNSTKKQWNWKTTFMLNKWFWISQIQLYTCGHLFQLIIMRNSAFFKQHQIHLNRLLLYRLPIPQFSVSYCFYKNKHELITINIRFVNGRFAEHN